MQDGGSMDSDELIIEVTAADPIAKENVRPEPVEVSEGGFGSESIS
jgi:hypothetical protein